MWLARCHRRETKETEEWLRPRCAAMNFVFRDRVPVPVVRQLRTCRYPPWLRSSTVSNVPWRSLGLNTLFLFSGNQAEAIRYSVQAEHITFIHSCLPCKTLDARIDGVHQCVNRIFLGRNGCPAPPLQLLRIAFPYSVSFRAYNSAFIDLSFVLSSLHPPKLTVTCRLSSIDP
jgi:hypothetical protein